LFLSQELAGPAHPAERETRTALSFTMPVLEDADSVQVALMQVMRLILAGQLDPKIAGLLLYAVQTASLNLRQMKLEPVHLESVVIDPRAVADNGVGDDAWCEEEFEEQEADEEEGEQEEGEEEDSGDEANADEEDEAEDSSEEDDEPARPSRKPVRGVRAAHPEHAEGPAAMSHRQPGANQKPIVAQLDENAITRHLLAALDFRSPPGVE
jgi:hypothetical protein